MRGEFARRRSEVTARDAWNLPHRLPFLSLGIDRASGGAGALLPPPSRWILVVRHFLRGFSRSPGVRGGGDSAGCWFAAERIPGIRSKVADRDGGKGHSRQSVGGQFRGTRRALLGRKTVRQSEGSAGPRHRYAQRFAALLLPARIVPDGDGAAGGG